MERMVDVFRLEEAAVISLVGAGGKTSVLYALAEEFAQEGRRTLATTTTKMRLPEAGVFQKILFGRQNLLEEGGEAGKVFSGESRDPASGKVMGYTVEDLRYLQGCGRYDKILIEADGAAGKSIKAPAPHEPVLYEGTDTVIGLLGLDALGKTLDEKIAHRAHLLRSMTGSEVVEARLMVELCIHPEGLFKGAFHRRKILLLNKADQVAKEEFHKFLYAFKTESAIMREIEVYAGSVFEKSFQKVR